MKKRSNANLKVLIIFGVVMLSVAIVALNVFVTTLTGFHLRSMTNVIDAKEGSQIKVETLVAQRGRFFDRNGSVVAQNQDTYTIYAVLSKDRPGEYAYVKDRYFTAESLAPILNMSVEEVMSYLDLQDEGRYQTYFGEKGKNLTLEQKKAIDAIVYTPDPEKETPGLPGIEFEETTTRVYTPGKFASSLLGFASYDNEAQRIKGQVGLEAYLDEDLTGTDGKITSKKDGNGYAIPGTEQTIELAKNGKDVYLTIDKDIQSALEASLKKSVEIGKAENAWGVVMEVETGKILAYAGNPTYDLNDRKEVIYTDYPSMFSFEPGSVMKSFTYATAMEEGVYDPKRKVETGRFCIAYNDKGEIYRNGGLGDCPMYGNVNDATREGWGTIPLDQGLLYSSNTCIATILTDYLNSNVFMDYLEKLGFFKATGMEGVELSEEGGIENRSHPIERLMAGFGQGQSVTTLQLMQAYTALFNDGHMIRPYVIDKIVDPSTNEIEQTPTTYVYTDKEGNSIPIYSKETTDEILRLLADVLQNEKGVSHAYNIDGLDMIGKTGTAEIASPNGGYRDGVYTLSIMAAAPSKDPKLMVYYAVQGSHAGNKTDYFKDVFRIAYEKMNLGDHQTSIEENDTSYDNWQEYNMPALKNHSLDFAKKKLETMKVHPIIIGDGTHVIEQSPAYAQKTSTNQNVFIVTNGTTITLPNMVGWSYRDVQTYKDLSKLNLKIEGSGVVISQSVEPKKVVTSDTEIILQLE